MIGISQKLKKWVKNHIFMALLVLWITVFISFYAISPRSATIYYSGSSEESRFEVVKEQRLMFEVRSNESTQPLMFRGSKEQIIRVVDYDLSQGMQLEDPDSTAHEDQIFPFNGGSAGFFCDESPILLTIRMPDNICFSYSLEVKNVATSEGAKNLITISNFPETAIVTMRSDTEIEIYGNRTEDQLQLAEYQIFNCDNISFYASHSQNDTANTKEEGSSDVFGWQKKSISFFEITNPERQTLEFTTDARVEFREIGHVTLSGNVESGKKLEVDISDFGAYPLPVTISGNVGKE